MVGKRRGRHVRHDLDAKKVAALVRAGTPGRHFDGEGLHLYVKPDGSASWVLRVTLPGQKTATGNPKRLDYGLGSAGVVSLAAARELAREARAVAKAGGDPSELRREQRQTPTFAELAREVHKQDAPTWRNKKHARQWLSTLETYAFPEFGGMRIDRIAVPHVLKVLSPIWLTRPETARRVRQRIGRVFEVAVGRQYRSDNPVGPALARALPAQSRTVRHHPALPYSDVPGFYARLSEGSDVSHLALRLLILTATRSNEVRGALRSEFNLDSLTWTIPATRMKVKREHRVPLSPEAAAIVTEALSTFPGDLVFPGRQRGKPLSDMALLMVCRRMGVGVVPHGFRSSFRDWAAEATGFPSEVAEMALAHSIANKVEAAYRRGDLFDKRRALMNAWASFVARAPGAAVVPLRRKGI